MAYALQLEKSDTLGAQLAAGASSGTLTTGNFGSPTGTQILVVDYNNANAEVISATIAGTALTSVVKGLDGTSDTTHAINAPVIMAFVPHHYQNGLGIIAAGDAWTSYSPTFSGFTTPPVVVARYRQLGTTVILNVTTTTPGTSLTNAFAISLPVAAVTRANQIWRSTAAITDNGATQAAVGQVRIISAATVASLFRDFADLGFTTGGVNKGGDFTIIYEAATAAGA